MALPPLGRKTDNVEAPIHQSRRIEMSGPFTNSDLSKQTALDLLSALSGEQVDTVLESHSAFDKDENWLIYGGGKKNWDRVNNQQSIAVGALTELITNSIDALLLRKAGEHGIGRRDNSTPQSMQEAVKRFYPEIPDGKLGNLSRKQRVKLAEESVLIGINRERKNSIYPNYTIVDFGEGQNHSSFKRTFLSLGEDNKEGIPFVQGRYNMGSTGTIGFCTRAELDRGMYKLILSKRNADDSDGLWGWTLIRVRPAKETESSPVAEYFCPDGKIPCFSSGEIRSFGNRSDIGVVRAGSIIKLYEYDVGPGARGRDTGLTNALTTSIMESALPIRIYDFDVQRRGNTGLRSEGISARIFTGMKGILTPGGTSGDEEEDLGEGLVDVDISETRSDCPGLGKIHMKFMGIQLPKIDYFKNLRDRVFFTINGQTHARHGTVFLMKAGLEDISSRMMVQIDCSEMDKSARAVLFKADRERMAKVEKSKQLDDIVLDFLKGNRAIREYANKVRSQRSREEKSDKIDKDFVAKLISKYDDLRELFNVGDRVKSPKQIPGGLKPFEGKPFPEVLKPPSLPDNTKSIPINGRGVLVCDTDANNDYLDREHDPGIRIQPDPNDLPHRFPSPHNGKVRITIFPPEDATVGDTISALFGFMDSKKIEPLQFEVNVRISEPVDQFDNSGGDSRTNVRPSAKLASEVPDFRWAGVDDCLGFDEDSGAWVQREGEGYVVWVNKDNRNLKHFLFKEGDENERKIIEDRFLIGVGILALAMYKRLIVDSDTDDESRVDAFKMAASGVAAHILSLVSEL